VVVLVDSWLHAPNAVASAIPVFAAAEPTCPPRAITYNIEDEEAQFNPVEIANAPLASVTAEVASKAVAPKPLPVDPAA